MKIGKLMARLVRARGRRTYSQSMKLRGRNGLGHYCPCCCQGGDVKAESREVRRARRRLDRAIIAEAIEE